MDEQKIKKELTKTLKKFGLVPNEVYMNLVFSRNPYIHIRFEADEEGQILGGGEKKSLFSRLLAWLF